MRVYVYQLTLLFLLFVLLLAKPAHAQPLLNPSPGTPGSGHAVFPPGSVNIIGNSGNGTDQISGIANLNGELWANNFSGADMGQKVNNAIGALPTGGVIRLPVGKFQFATTIQCPLSSDAPIIIQGSGQATVGDSNPNWSNQGTLLQYTGNGDAINQVMVAAHQNYIGCQLRDLTLDGSLGGTSAVGFHFGGTQLSGTSHVSIASFGKAGIELENDAPGPSGFASTWTERYSIKDTAIYRNPGIGIWFNSTYQSGNVNNWSSFAHGTIEIWLNATGSSTGMEIDGSGNLYGSTVTINGNVELNTATVITLTNYAQFEQNFFILNTECMQNVCTRFKVDATSTVGFDGSALQEGQFQDTIAPGGVLVASALNMGNPLYPGGIYTSGTVFPQAGGKSLYSPNANPNWFQNGSINTASNQFIIGTAAHSRITWDCSGLILVTENTGHDQGVYACGGNICTFIGSSNSTFGHIWAASSNAPAAGTASVAWDNVNGGYNIYNNTGTQRTFAVMSLINSAAD
jgi:hypothetical protein